MQGIILSEKKNIQETPRIVMILANTISISDFDKKKLD